MTYAFLNVRLHVLPSLKLNVYRLYWPSHPLYFSLPRSSPHSQPVAQTAFELWGQSAQKRRNKFMLTWTA